MPLDAVLVPGLGDRARAVADWSRFTREAGVGVRDWAYEMQTSLGGASRPLMLMLIKSHDRVMIKSHNLNLPICKVSGKLFCANFL